MAHQLETFTDGTAAFVSARQDAWHQLGTVTRDCLTAEQVMTTAWLGGWNVRKQPLATTVTTPGGVTTLPVPDRFATVRDHPKTGAPEVLGIVGVDYLPVQNEDCAELLNILVEESGAHFETAGSLRGGRQVFITMKLPHGMRIAGVDTLDLYLAVTTSHDGSAALRVDATPIRVVCANTQQMALRASRSHYSFRHTKGATGKIAQARQALGLMHDYHAAFEAEAEKMINATLATDEFARLCREIWPVPDPDASARTRNNHTRRTAILDALFADAATQAAIRGTRWAGLQAICEYLDHHTPAADPDVRATRVLTSAAVADTKQRAYELLAV